MIDKDALGRKDWKRMTPLEGECVRQDLLTRLVRPAAMEPKRTEGIEIMALIALTGAGTRMGLTGRIRSEMAKLRATGVQGNMDFVTDLMAEFEAGKVRGRKTLSFPATQP
jgi:hypothetical protein